MHYKQNNISKYISLNIKRDFPQDPMMQALHQIRKNLTVGKTLEQTLKSVERIHKNPR